MTDFGPLSRRILQEENDGIVHLLERFIDALGDSPYRFIYGQVSPVTHVDNEIGCPEAGGAPQFDLHGIKGFSVENPIPGGQVGKIGHMYEERGKGCLRELFAKQVHILLV